jgi:uncharacterized membrane protein YkvA (DUF1232 family)
MKLARAVPRHGRIVYCLYRDPRTPRWWKLGLAAAVVAILSPLTDPLDWIPVVGEMSSVALALVAVQFFITRAPQELVDEHEAAIATGTSLYHRDLDLMKERVEDTRMKMFG